MNLFLAAAFESVVDLFWCLSPFQKEVEGVRNLLKWRRDEISSHEETLIDSYKRYLLLATRDGLHLVHRKWNWRGRLDTTAMALYERRGRRAFRRKHRHLLNIHV